jgi:hypothetical protein
MAFERVVSFLSLLSWTNNPIGLDGAPAPALSPLASFETQAYTQKFAHPTHFNPDDGGSMH